MDAILSTAKLLHEWTLAEGDRIGVEEFAFDLEIAAIAAQASGTVLHVGSRASVIDTNRRWRKVFGHCRVVGLDVAEGDNVDVVGDITAPAADLRRRLGIKAFDAVICRHVLEHVPAPWDAARNLQFLLKPGGLLLAAVPWVQGYHDFPDDYWRMSFSGLRRLLPDIAPELEFYTGAREDKAWRLLFNGRPEHSPRTLRIERNLFQLILDHPPAQPMFDDRLGTKIIVSRPYMPACSVNLIGRRKR